MHPAASPECQEIMLRSSDCCSHACFEATHVHPKALIYHEALNGKGLPWREALHTGLELLNELGVWEAEARERG